MAYYIRTSIQQNQVNQEGFCVKQIVDKSTFKYLQYVVHTFMEQRILLWQWRWHDEKSVFDTYYISK